jgi:hypothetical protein
VHILPTLKFMVLRHKIYWCWSQNLYRCARVKFLNYIWYQ